MACGLGEGYDGFGGFGFGDQELQEAGVEEGEIDGEDEVGVGGGVCEGGVDSAEGAAGEVDVGDNWGKRGKLFGVTYDFYIWSDGAGEVESTGEQGAALEIQEGFIRAHSGAFASGEDEGGEGGHGEIIQGAARCPARSHSNRSASHQSLRAGSRPAGESAGTSG